MKNTLSYRGILLILKQSVKEHTYFGKLDLIDDEVSFECYKFSRIKPCFESVVEDYLVLKAEKPNDPLLVHFVDL